MSGWSHPGPVNKSPKAGIRSRNVGSPSHPSRPNSDASSGGGTTLPPSGRAWSPIRRRCHRTSLERPTPWPLGSPTTAHPKSASTWRNRNSNQSEDNCVRRGHTSTLLYVDSLSLEADQVLALFDHVIPYSSRARSVTASSIGTHASPSSVPF